VESGILKLKPTPHSSFLVDCRGRRLGLHFEFQLAGGEFVQRGIGVVWIAACRANDTLALKAELARSMNREQLLVDASFRLKVVLPFL
jgi:hypothetical protein